MSAACQSMYEPLADGDGMKHMNIYECLAQHMVGAVVRATLVAVVLTSTSVGKEVHSQL